MGCADNLHFDGRLVRAGGMFRTRNAGVFRHPISPRLRSRSQLPSLESYNLQQGALHIQVENTHYTTLSTRSIMLLSVISGNRFPDQFSTPLSSISGDTFKRTECSSHNCTRRRSRSDHRKLGSVFPVLRFSKPGGTWIAICRRSRWLDVMVLSAAIIHSLLDNEHRNTISLSFVTLERSSSLGVSMDGWSGKDRTEEET